MSKENITIEISDEELNKVSGGETKSPKTYYFGDVYKSKMNVYYVVTDQMNTSGDVNSDYYNNEACETDDFVGKTSVPRVYFNGYQYVKHIDNYNPR